MVKKILTPLVFALSVGSFSAYAQFGGAPGGGDGNGGGSPEDPQSIEQLIYGCTEDLSASKKRECIQYGFEYETAETSFYISDTEEMTFNSDTIMFQGGLYSEHHYDLRVECSDCTSGNRQSRISALVNRVASGIVSAHRTNGFQTKKSSKNGQATPNAPTNNNNGKDASQYIKNITSAAKDVSDVLKDWLGGKDDKVEVEFLLSTDFEGNPTQIVRIGKDGKVTTVADLTRAILGTDRTTGNASINFSGTIQTGDGARFEHIIEGAVATAFQNLGGGGGGTVTCRIVYSGENGKLVAQVSCF